MQSLTCPRCAGAFVSSEESAGRVVACPHCHAQIQDSAFASSEIPTETSVETGAPTQDPPVTLPLPSPSEEVGKTPQWPNIPEHDVLKFLGKGGMGIVLQARHRVLDRLVAVKMPLAGDWMDDADRERFLREARATAKLRHPNICPVFEVGETENRPYITMAYIEGESLVQWARDRKPNGREAAEMLAVLARAVEFAHQQGIVHRDIKPQNVLVDRASGQPMLMDFGLAKEMALADSELTQSGQVLGTPAYMAPEQAAGRLRDVGPRSDVYALGAVLYHLLCGRPPYLGGGGEVLRQLQTDVPPAPRKLAPNTNRDLETICLTAMAREPLRRYESASALAADLQR
ncbi:MAG TPA: serine/threonine-protein kinase, partial [Pirellulales bacterium]|nr:serine/threonine-protein kinase [Pirellulales bacterium]